MNLIDFNNLSLSLRRSFTGHKINPGVSCFELVMILYQHGIDDFFDQNLLM